MAITREQLDTIMVRRIGSLLTECNMDGTTTDGTNTDLVEPLRWALAQAGYSTASIVDVTNTDLLSVATTDLDKLLDLFELRCLESASTKFTNVDEVAGPRERKYSQLGRRLADLINDKSKLIESEHGIILRSRPAYMQVY